MGRPRWARFGLSHSLPGRGAKVEPLRWPGGHLRVLIRGEAERGKVLEYTRIELGDGWARRTVRGSHPVHLPEVVDRPAGQRLAERKRRMHGDQAVVGPFHLAKYGVQSLERPGYFAQGWITRQAEARNVARLLELSVEPCAERRVMSRNPR